MAARERYNYSTFVQVVSVESESLFLLLNESKTSCFLLSVRDCPCFQYGNFEEMLSCVLVKTDVAIGRLSF